MSQPIIKDRITFQLPLITELNIHQPVFSLPLKFFSSMLLINLSLDEEVFIVLLSHSKYLKIIWDLLVIFCFSCGEIYLNESYKLGACN